MTAPNLTPDERVDATLAFLRDILGLQVSAWQERAVEQIVAPLRPPARPVPPPGGAVHWSGVVHRPGPDFSGSLHGGPRAGCPACPPGDPADTSPEQERAARLHADPMDDAPDSEWRARRPLPTPDSVTVGSLLQDPRAVREALADLYERRQTWSAVPDFAAQKERDLTEYRKLGVACPACDALMIDGAVPASETCTHPWHGPR